MNREIQELREVITKLVPLLTGKGLRVTQRGTQAYVQANARTNKPEVVNIPSIPDNASSDFISAVAGFVDHEVAHVLFTDWKHYGGDGVRVSKSSPEGQALTIMHNIMEDTFIEREIAKTFPGSQRNLDKLHRHFLEKITTPALVSAKGNEKTEFDYLIVPMFRALSGQEIFQEFMDVNGYWKHPMVENLHMALSDEALELIKTAATTQDTFEVAQEVHDILFNNRKKDGSPVTPPAKKGKSQDKPEKQAGQGDGTGKRKHDDEGDDAPSSSSGESGKSGAGPEPDDSGTQTKGSESDDENAEAGSGEGQSEDENDEGGEESADADGNDSESSTEEEDGEGDAGGDDEGDEGEDSGADEQGDDDADDGNAADEGVSESEEDDGSGLSEGEGEEEEEHEDNQGSETAGTDDVNRSGGGIGGEAGKSMFDLDPEDFKPLDLSSAVSKEIEKMATKAIGESDYSVFTKDEDRIEPLTVEEQYMNDKWVPALEEATSALVGPMQKDIERLMAAQSLSVRTAGHRSGRLHSASLYRVLQGDARVFQRKQEHNSKDTAVMLLIDNSGSMHGDRIVVAMQSAYALAQTLERVSIANEILGFTTGGLSYGAAQQLRKEHDKGTYFMRSHSIIMPIYKSFNERVTPLVKKRIAYQMNVQSGMNTNTDGESLEYAALRLIPRREQRKVMLVLSDGQPVGNGSGWHLKETVRKLNKMGVETVGIGIQSSAVQNYYDRSMVLNKVADLPAAVMGELKRILSR